MKLPEQLQWNRLAAREQMILGLTAVVILSIVGFLLYEAQQKKVIALKRELETVENQINMLQAELPLRQVAVQRAEGQQAEAQEQLSLVAKTQQQLKGGQGFSALMSEIARMARDEGIEVMSIELGTPRDQGNYVEVPVTIKVSAQFRRLGEYLHRLQQLPQLVVVGKVKMETTSQTSPLLNAGVETISFMGKT